MITINIDFDNLILSDVITCVDHDCFQSLASCVRDIDARKKGVLYLKVTCNTTYADIKSALTDLNFNDVTAFNNTVNDYFSFNSNLNYAPNSFYVLDDETVGFLTVHVTL